MALTSKLRQDYVELADGYLSGISAYAISESGSDVRQSGGTTGLQGKPEDIIEALSSITDPDGEHEVKEPLKEGVGAIKELIENPEMYVRNPADYDEFKGIITSRIQKKIDDLRALSPEEAQQQQELQQQNTELARQAQETMANASPPQPGTAAHSLSERDWLNEQFGTGAQTQNNPVFRENLDRYLISDLINNSSYTDNNNMDVVIGSTFNGNNFTSTNQIIEDTGQVAFNNPVTLGSALNDSDFTNTDYIINDNSQMTNDNPITQSIRDVLSDEQYNNLSDVDYRQQSNNIRNRISDLIRNRQDTDFRERTNSERNNINRSR